ncbi:MAG: tRNA (adenosine(37)-N6)-dimethylallyltransferase MiaA [Sphingobacteriia bacterium]|nr:MAG: tRNA (adenosine(37)-N6)-dimethylallyltransferase MiaA [Sphingobacteriia bacterium]
MVQKNKIQILNNSGLKKVFVVVGPTAIGKTSFAIQLAQSLGTEIISADSRQCFKELSIGVARPSIEELNTITHHFIATNSVAEDLNAGYFEQYALEKSRTIFQQHDSLVMVGGTGLYIKSFCEGIDPMPIIPPEIRAAIIQEYNTNGLIWLQTELKHKDPAFWAVAEQQNPQRLMRALEVLLATGQSIIVFRTAEKKQRDFEIIKIGLEMPLDQLTLRINQRVDQMMKAGLLDEAQSVIGFREKAALQTVGYKELFDYIDGKISLEEAIQQIKVHTRQYAKRQMTWFKKDTDIKWYDSTKVSLDNVIQSI